MTNRVIDESHFNFHVMCKAKIVNAVNNLKKGKDFLKTLSDLAFSTDKRWIANKSKNPNVELLLEILEEYKKVEHRPSRAKVIIPIIEYAIALYASDLFYVERGEWFIYQVCLRTHRFQFHECFVNPDNWYPLKRKDADPGTAEISDEYQTWYGINPNDENSIISYDMKRRDELIESQRKIFEEQISAPRRWAEAELEKI